MKIIDAYWEKRNLGITTTEVEITNDDTLNECCQALETIESEYVVVKIPNERTDLLLALQKMNFLYVEDMFLMKSRLERITLPKVMQRIFDEVTICEMVEEDFPVLFNEVRNGLFSTDRISIDPYFTKQQACNRYIGWVKDEIARGTSLYKYIYKNNTIGFFGLKEIDNKCFTSFLGGIYEAYRKGGIGTIVKVPEVVRTLGGRCVETQVSSNNLVQVRSLLLNGYSIQKGVHVLIKHN